MALSNPSFNAKTTAEEAAKALKESITGKNILLVGATVGSLGGEFLRVIAPYAKAIWFLSHTKARMQQVVDNAFKALEPNAHRPAMKLIEVDMTSLDSVRKAAGEVNADKQPIDLLFLSHGIPQRPQPYYTLEGFETMFAGNYLGSFLLTSLLLPLLRQAGPSARIVPVSSSSHAMQDFRWDDPHYKLRPQEWDSQAAYGQSKAAQALFTKGLAKKLAADKITAITLHPGLVMTPGALSCPDSLWIKVGLKTPDGNWTPLLDKAARPIEQGVSNFVVAGFDPALKGTGCSLNSADIRSSAARGGFISIRRIFIPSIDHSGQWIEDCQIHNERVAPWVNDENAERLWVMTEKMIGHKFF
ncbi:NAD(P)-binding protein [Clavulina sp. PMI_390]|nr:NAD(P)-binding protein [Clavulina sp. PMI_390]